MDKECGDKGNLDSSHTPFFISPPKNLPEELFRTCKEFEDRFLHDLSNNIEKAGRLVPALKKKRQKLPLSIQGRLFRLVGRYYACQSRHRQSIFWTKKALSLFEQDLNHECTHQCQLTLLSSEIFLGQYQSAQKRASMMLAHYKNVSGIGYKVSVNLGNLAQRQHDYRLAFKQFQTALTYKDNKVTRSQLGILYYNMGNTLVQLNEFNQAENQFEQALYLFKSENNLLYQAYVYQALAYLHMVLGQYFKAEQNIGTAKEIYSDCGDRMGAAYCLLEAFRIKIRNKHSGEVVNQADQALNLFAEAGLKYEQGLLNFLMAQAFWGTEDHELVPDYLKRARDIFSKEQNLLFLARCLLLEARFLAQKNKKPSALLQKAYQIFRTLKARDFELQCMIHMAEIEQTVLDGTGRKRLKQLLNGSISHETRILSLSLLARDYFYRAQKKRAIATLYEAVSLLEEARATIIEPKVRVDYFHEFKHIYETLIQWLCQWKHPEAAQWAFNLMELGRNRLFYEQLGKQESLKTDDSSLLNLQALHARRGQLKRKLEWLVQHPEEPKEVGDELKTSLKSLEKEWDIQKSNMRSQHRLGLYFPFQLKPEDFQNLLSENQMIVVYFKTDHQIFRFQLTSKRLQLFSREITADFKRSLKQLLGLLQSGVPIKQGLIQKHISTVSKILAPVVPKNTEHLFIVPHKELQAFPFSVLERSGRPLITSFSMNVCPNLPILLFSLKKESSDLSHPLFFFSDHSDDPQASEREVLDSMFPEAKCASTFSELNFPMELGRTHFFHFAGHCSINLSSPLDSYLEISGEKMPMQQIKHTPLNPAFINLATCGSGSHILQQGNEPGGFVSTLLANGATSILATLWEINDQSTGLWMQEFYTHIHSGLARAHQAACIALIDAGYSPHHWAPYRLSGKS